MFVSIYIDDIEEYKKYGLGNNTFEEGIYDLSERVSGSTYINTNQITFVCLDNNQFRQKSMRISFLQRDEINLIFGLDEDEEYYRILYELGLQDERQSHQEKDDFGFEEDDDDDEDFLD